MQCIVYFLLARSQPHSRLSNYPLKHFRLFKLSLLCHASHMQCPRRNFACACMFLDCHRGTGAWDMGNTDGMSSFWSIYSSKINGYSKKKNRASSSHLSTTNQAQKQFALLPHATDALRQNVPRGGLLRSVAYPVKARSLEPRYRRCRWSRVRRCAV